MKCKIWLLLVLFPCLIQSQITLYHNARIFTSNRDQPYAEAIAISGKKILAVGSFNEVKKAAGHQAKWVDCQGKFLMAGLIDSHIHAFWGGQELTKANLNDKEVSIAELVSYAKSELNRKDAFTGDVLLIHGINLSTWSHIDELIVEFNKDEFTKIPVVLGGMDGHTAWSNQVMLKRAGLDKSFIDTLKPEDKIYYGVTQAGQPNGFVSEKGLELIQSVIPKDYNIPQAAENCMTYLNQLGITAFLDPSAGNSERKQIEPLEGYSWLSKNNKLNAHVAALVVCDPASGFPNQLNTIKILKNKYKTNNLSILGCKIFADGVLEYPTQTASLSIPYTGTSSKGVLMFEPKQFTSFAIAADKAGMLVHVHAIGDQAVTESLNGFETMRKTNGYSKIPHTITHLQLVVPSDFERFKQLKVLAAYQLLWALGDFTTIDIVQPYIDPSLYNWMYPSRSMLQAGATISGASDWPVSSANPFEAIYYAETRKGSKGVLDSTQCMPRIEMLYAYTIHSAKAMMADKMIGSLEVGKSADMILLDRDILTIDPEMMKETKVVWTVFEGKKVYEQRQTVNE